MRNEGKPNTIYARRRDYIEKLARRVFQDPATYGVIWGAEEKDDPHAPSTWAKANPGYPISPTKRYLEGASKKAQNSPVELASFQRLHLGIRTKQKTRFVLLRDWDRNAGVYISPRRLNEPDEELVWENPEWEQFRNAEAWGGIDLASVSDLSSLCWLLPRDMMLGDREVTGYRAVWHNWAPEGALEDLDKRTADAASLWVKQGWLTLTPGDVTDYDFIRDQVLSDLDFFDVQSIGFDPYNASQLTNDLTAAGAPMIRVRQGFITMSPPTKEIQRLVKLGRRDAPLIEHGGNPVVRWAVDNLAVAIDAAGNVKPDKEHSGDKIDPVAALATALSEAMTRSQRSRSAYADGGVAYA